jgi:MFS family permease
MKLPPALAPLRHTLFRMLWSANVVGALGVWMQNTGAGWLMTTLSPDPLTVSLVQVATILPVFLLALPAGAIADIVDRRRFLIATQGWMLIAAAVLTALTFAGRTEAWSLLALTFAIGVGSAMNNPAWGSVMAEVVPRSDLVQAVALNGVGFNIARALGPAIAGLLVLAGGPSLAFSVNVLSYVAVIWTLVSWHRRSRKNPLPREHLASAIRAGVRFVRHTPAVRAAMARSAAYFLCAAAPWAMLPLVVREQLHLGAAVYGLLLGLMGVGGVTAGMLLPQMRARLSRSNVVVVASLISFAGMAILAFSRHWLPAALGMVMFGVGWVTTSSVAQAAAQLSAPSWVRSRALAIYQFAQNFALTIGTFLWGWVGTRLGIPAALLAAAATGALLAVLARGFDIDRAEMAPSLRAQPSPPEHEAVAPELATVLPATRGRVLESQHYRIRPQDRDLFLAAMADVRAARSRAGAIAWQLYEDVAHADGWLEIWSVGNWADHLREAARMDEADRACVARALSFHNGEPAAPSRYIAVAPHRLPQAGLSRNAV